MSYHFNLTLRPYGDSPEAGIVGIDTAAQYGYWEYSKGSEGGGLWFKENDDGRMELVDYDGAGCLPAKVVQALRDAGFYLEEGYF